MRYSKGCYLKDQEQSLVVGRINGFTIIVVVKITP